MWNGWLGLASPVISNMGTDRGLPISCYGIDTPDSIRGIGLTNAELMRLTSKGGGVGIGVLIGGVAVSVVGMEAVAASCTHPPVIINKSVVIKRTA